jgi:hypothetical protein
MERTQWVVTLHFNRGHNQVIKFDTKAAALNCIRVSVFTNEDCINFSCYRETVMRSSIEDKLDQLKRSMDLVAKITAKM